MEAEGEIFDARRLWPPPSPESLEFSNRLAQEMGQLPTGLANYAGMLSGIVPDQPGYVRRGSQEQYPPISQKRASTNPWQDLDTPIGQAQLALESLRQLMKNPPSDMGYDIVERLGTDSIPNLVSVRRTAQALHAAAIDDLHNGNLAGALENLTALSGLVRLYADAPTLVNFMIRVAITGLSVDICWDALQAKGWTEPQLAAFQQACQDDKLLLAQMSRSMEAERAARLHELAWFRSHSYKAWAGRYGEILQSFGVHTQPGLLGWFAAGGNTCFIRFGASPGPTRRNCSISRPFRGRLRCCGRRPSMAPGRRWTSKWQPTTRVTDRRSQLGDSMLRFPCWTNSRKSSVAHVPPRQLIPARCSQEPGPPP